MKVKTFGAPVTASVGIVTDPQSFAFATSDDGVTWRLAPGVTMKNDGPWVEFTVDAAEWTSFIGAPPGSIL